VNTQNRLKYFLTNKIFLLHIMYRYIRMIFVVKCVIITFFNACAALLWKKNYFYCSVIPETVHDSVQYKYCIFSLLYRLLRIMLKCQNPLLSYVREREKVHCKCTMWCTVHFIITLFNADVLLGIIYQLKFIAFMHVTRISLSIMLYAAFGIICGFP
jgi:hypothetical protein